MANEISENNYYLIFYWMLNELGLKGAELPIFAIIYSFSQDGVSTFNGSLNYLSKFAGVSKQTVINSLKSLCDKNLIIKDTTVRNNIRFNTYQINLPVVKKFDLGSQNTLTGWSNNFNGGSQISLPNNKRDNKEIINDNTYGSKKAYGYYKHVFLTKKEYDKLQNDFGNADELIKYLDEAIEMKGYQYKSHYLAIRRWVVDAVKKEKAKKPAIDSTYDINSIEHRAMFNDEYEI